MTTPESRYAEFREQLDRELETHRYRFKATPSVSDEFRLERLERMVFELREAIDGATNLLASLTKLVDRLVPRSGP